MILDRLGRSERRWPGYADSMTVPQKMSDSITRAATRLLGAILCAGVLAGCNAGGGGKSREKWHSVPFRVTGAERSIIYLEALSGGCGPQNERDIRVASLVESTNEIKPHLLGKYLVPSGNTLCPMNGLSICLQIATARPVGNRGIVESGESSLSSAPKVVRAADRQPRARDRRQFYARMRSCPTPSG